MATGEKGAQSVGWVDCGFDTDGKQVYVNLLTLRHIVIKPGAGGLEAPEGEMVTLRYMAVEEPVQLGAEHSREFLIKAGLRKEESSSLWTPDADRKLPIV